MGVGTETNAHLRSGPYDRSQATARLRCFKRVTRHALQVNASRTRGAISACFVSEALNKQTMQPEAFVQSHKRQNAFSQRFQEPAHEKTRLQWVSLT